jgi:hypothetical protein
MVVVDVVEEVDMERSNKMVVPGRIFSDRYTKKREKSQG